MFLVMHTLCSWIEGLTQMMTPKTKVIIQHNDTCGLEEKGGINWWRWNDATLRSYAIDAFKAFSEKECSLESTSDRRWMIQYGDPQWRPLSRPFHNRIILLNESVSCGAAWLVPVCCFNSTAPRNSWILPHLYVAFCRCYFSHMNYWHTVVMYIFAGQWRIHF